MRLKTVIILLLFWELVLKEPIFYVIFFVLAALGYGVWFCWP